MRRSKKYLGRAQTNLAATEPMKPSYSQGSLAFKNQWTRLCWLLRYERYLSGGIGMYVVRDSKDRADRLSPLPVFVVELLNPLTSFLSV